jgi:hypothetical protein
MSDEYFLAKGLRDHDSGASALAPTVSKVVLAQI